MLHNYSYLYDKLNRLTNGTSDEGFNELISYDKMGNIISMNRNPVGASSYSYSGNRLMGISGAINGSYSYDANGNQTADSHKGITLAYNYLNLPETISKASTSETMSNTWLATGAKIKKTVGGMTREYANGIEYNDGVIEFIQTEEGRAIMNSNATYSYEYMLKDHLGNTRVLLDEYGTVLETSDYYPFGLQVARGQTVTSPENRYKYNGKELQTELGLMQYDYGARFYDPVIGRFTGVDPIAEKFPHVTVYNYAENSPISNIDLWGLQAENFMSKFKQLNDLKEKVPDMSKAQIQVYQTVISDPKVSIDEIKHLFLTSPQDILSNSKAVFHSPVDGNGDAAKFEKGNFIKIDINGPMNDGYVKIHDVKSDENSAKATFVTMEGHLEKGVIIFKVKGEKNGKISFRISSASQVDMGLAPEKFSRKEQAASWNEVLNNIIDLTEGEEDHRINYIQDPR